MRRRSFLLTPLLAPGLAAAAPATPYAPARRGTPLAFPRDHGGHAGFRTEWWYVTGALDAPERDIGFQLTFFRVRSGSAEALDSPFAPRQILFAHAAVTLPGDRLRHAERAARANLGAAFSAADCNVHIGPWSMQRAGNAADEHIRLRVLDAAFAFDLRLTPTQPLLLQGESGWSQKGPRPDLASHYISWPQLRVEGQLTLDNASRAASGLAWFDHEWSSEVLGDTGVGWDWIGINLEDGGALMAFRIRDRSGATVYAHAGLRYADGRQARFGPAEVSFMALQHWQSPRNGARYPVGMEIKIGPHVFRTTAVLDDQEITTRRPLPISYWEGLVKLDGTLRGRGYLELTGYAQAMAL